MDLSQLLNILIDGNNITDEQAYQLSEVDSEALFSVAAEVTQKNFDRRFDSCSIINAKSGRCPEDCKWCAQSAHYNTGCEIYDMIPEDECLAMAKANAEAGIRRFSLVTSGKRLSGKSLDKICYLYNKIQSTCNIELCASLGLLSKDELQKIWDCGVRRYHCNLESAPSHFVKLCTTHTIEDKIATINAAREIGLEICSGGIIGMGETENQRIEFALTLRKVDPLSIPINILCPIAGTPLEGTTPLSEDEILRTVAIFRLLHPQAYLRFAGGRMKLSTEGQIRAMKIGINGGIVGDMLTTIGSTVERDRNIVSAAGYHF